MYIGHIHIYLAVNACDQNPDTPPYKGFQLFVTTWIVILEHPGKNRSLSLEEKQIDGNTFLDGATQDKTPDHRPVIENPLVSARTPLRRSSRGITFSTEK